MSYSIPSKDLDQSNFSNLVLDAHPIIKKYVLTRLKQENDLKEFKKSHDYNIKEIKQSLAEDGISYRRINDATNMLKRDCNIFSLCSSEIIEKTYKIIMSSVLGAQGFSRYSENKEMICTAIQNIIDKKENLKSFKAKQSVILKEIVEEVKGEGLPLYMVRDRYSALKNEIKALETDCGDDIEIYRSERTINIFNTYDFVFTEIFETIYNEKKRIKIMNKVVNIEHLMNDITFIRTACLNFKGREFKIEGQWLKFQYNPNKDDSFLDEFGILGSIQSLNAIK